MLLMTRAMLVQAMETKKEDAKLSYVNEGLEVAVTDAARAKLVGICLLMHSELEAAIPRVVERVLIKIMAIKDLELEQNIFSYQWFTYLLDFSAKGKFNVKSNVNALSRWW